MNQSTAIYVACCAALVLALRVAAGTMPAGESPVSTDVGKPRYTKLITGELLKIGGNQSFTSVDDGKTWQPGGAINPYNSTNPWDPWDASLVIELQRTKHRGRLVVPCYMGMYADHPDYTREQMGGYGTYKGKRILMETHTHVPEMCGSYVCYSDDKGKTWQASKGFVMGYFKDGYWGHSSCEEPSVAELKDGRLLMFMRSTTGRILKSYSNDGGEYWMMTQATDLAASNSPNILKRIPTTGDLVLVWNQMSAAEIRAGHRRGRLSIAISKDDGNTWINFRTLELSSGVKDVKRVKPEKLQPMVRGPIEMPTVFADDYVINHYPQVFFEDDKILVYYLRSTPIEGVGSKWRAFPIGWLYQP